VVLIAAWFWTWVLSSRGEANAIGFGKVGPGFVWGIVAGVVPMLMSWGILALMGVVEVEQGLPVLLPSGVIVSILLLPTFVAHGMAEQLLLQRVLQGALRRVFPPQGALHLISALMAGLGLAAVQWLQGYTSPIEVFNSFLIGSLLGLVALSPGGIWAAAVGHGLWTWVESQLITETLKLRVILTDPPTYLAGPGPDTYTSEVFSLVLLVAIMLAAWHRLRSSRKTSFQVDG
jgi:hypothetical protein